MPSLKWSPRSLADVQRLYRFLAQKNPDAAKRAVRAIRAGVKILLHQPQAGRSADDISAEVREWVIDFGRDGYVALYRYYSDHDEIVILAVRQGREAGY